MNSFRCGLILENVLDGIGFCWMSEEASGVFPDILFILMYAFAFVFIYPTLWFFHACTYIRNSVSHALRAFYYFVLKGAYPGFWSTFIHIRDGFSTYTNQLASSMHVLPSF